MWQKLQLLYAWYFSERLTRDTQNGALIAFDVGDLLAALSDEGSLKVMLLCGSDLLESFDIPGAWICDQVRMICRDYGIVCIRREGNDIDKIIAGDDILFEK
ncbi:nicotinamide/nicotinic acid mononucleotide adenylyltransferase-like isoform X1 [Amborella trichopoda]|uniref:nicotinamide/nicotinic acid mononucleotide adenylyltransferase-like isoform X1 n=1 Tax=Amborella trichopoda TaxID=13333 RepID=UPI0009BECD95|nr:nicotinamide/nicotinic acid mononucleotide adenylyltransferase-like isoform X1 [Amborella trichopoda]|eukprot:XP_020529179.1 nicotinamide/nicotinic acid mononucleotide adenylyltransferase-like isoform X1 [Amborella trichopoda]